MSRPYEYVLRYTVAPGHFEQERFDALVSFCKETGTTDVMFFLLSEELNTGHATMAELDEWLGVVERGKRRLDEIGVKTSINPWMTTLHCDRGRRLKPGQSFRTMVDPEGHASSAVACPLDAAWRDNLAACYARYAALNPNVLWIEDDFRLHNHEPLTWGGCFCDEHMKIYSERAGKPLTREEFAAGITAPGEAHPYRKIWLDVARDTMIDLAKFIARSVFAVNPGVRLGLMTSSPSVHCTEGRDWAAIMDALTGEKRPIVRIHLPAYSECTAYDYGINFRNISRMTKALLPKDIEIYPELENFCDTRYAKSNAFTAFQTELSAQLGAHGITMNIYDMMGNGVLPGEGYQRMLARVKPFMDRTMDFGIDKAEQRGVLVPINPEASRYLHAVDTHTPGGIQPREYTLGVLMSAFSIACRYHVGAIPKGAVAALSGQYLRALSDEAISALFAENTLFIDGETVLTLKDRGLLRLIGATDARVVEAATGVVSYEQIANGRRYAGVECARIGAQVAVGDFVLVDYAPDAALEVVSDARTPEGKIVAPAMTIANGRTFVMPYVQPERSAHRTTIVCEVMQDALERMSGATPTYAVDAPYLHAFDYILEDGSRLIALTNTSSDAYENVDLRLEGGVSASAKFTLYSREAVDGRAANARADGQILRLNEAIRPMETIFLKA